MGYFIDNLCSRFKLPAQPTLGCPHDVFFLDACAQRVGLI